MLRKPLSTSSFLMDSTVFSKVESLPSIFLTSAANSGSERSPKTNLGHTWNPRKIFIQHFESPLPTFHRLKTENQCKQSHVYMYKCATMSIDRMAKDRKMSEATTALYLSECLKPLQFQKISGCLWITTPMYIDVHSMCIFFGMLPLPVTVANGGL